MWLIRLSCFKTRDLFKGIESGTQGQGKREGEIVGRM